MDWLVVTGGAHRQGGQDRANLELLPLLTSSGTRTVHVVAHELDAEVASFPGVRLNIIPRPLHSTDLGERLLEPAARRVHGRLGAGGIVLANGGNYSRAHANWV